jgi:hypothetical protein
MPYFIYIYLDRDRALDILLDSSLHITFDRFGPAPTLATIWHRGISTYPAWTQDEHRHGSGRLC